MGTQNPRFFPLMGTVPSTKYCWAPGSCPSVKILSKSVGHGSLGVWEQFVIVWPKHSTKVCRAFGNVLSLPGVPLSRTWSQTHWMWLLLLRLQWCCVEFDVVDDLLLVIVDVDLMLRLMMMSMLMSMSVLVMFFRMMFIAFLLWERHHLGL